MNPVKYQKTDEIQEKGGKIYDVVRGKWVKSTPEERVRQALVASLTKELGYPLERIREEVSIKMGSTYASKKADVVIYADKRAETMHIIFETKKPKRKDGIEQLESYMNATGVYFGGWINGTEPPTFLFRRDPNIFEYLPRLPAVNEDIDDVRKPLTKQELQPIENLKETVQDLENTVLANAGVSAFDGMFPMLFAKLWDEFFKGPKDTLDFRTTTAPPQEQAKRLKGVFTRALKTWQDVLFEQDWPDISPESLVTIASALQHLKFQDADLDIIDTAFEYMINPEQKADKGQFFTPRPVVKMAVKMLNPQPDELLIDPACGPCGFMIHSLYWVVDKYLKTKYGDDWKSHRSYFARSNLFAIDFDPRLVKVAKAMMLIAGDGHTNVYRVNSLDPREWKGRIDGLVEAIKDGKFDVLMTNPPFAGKIKQPEILGTYDLAYKGDSTKYKRVNTLTRDVIFIERCLRFLRPGGRMAIVLPQGNLNNTNAEFIRKYIMDKARILAVVGLHVNTFKPFTGTKTSVLFLQKWHSTDGILEDYPIFMAVNEKPVKDNSGEYIFIKDKQGIVKKDDHGRPIIDHDLDEIADEFVRFAEEQDLDFFGENDGNMVKS